MPQCEACNADVLPDSQFCEACGHKIGTTPAGKQQPSSEAAKPGSLRSEVAFLAGAVDQAKVRLENWRQKGEQAKMHADREAEIQRQDREEERKRSSSPLQKVMQFMIGLVALAAFVYLLVRMPRKGNPAMMLQLYEEFRKEFWSGDFFDE